MKGSLPEEINRETLAHLPPEDGAEDEEADAGSDARRQQADPGRRDHFFPCRGIFRGTVGVDRDHTVRTNSSSRLIIADGSREFILPCCRRVPFSAPQSERSSRPEIKKYPSTLSGRFESRLTRWLPHDNF